MTVFLLLVEILGLAFEGWLYFITEIENGSFVFTYPYANT